MNSMEQKISSKLINSQFYLNHLDSYIVQLVKAISLEQSLTPDPDAKDIVRALIQDRVNSLLNNSEKDIINKSYNLIIDDIKKNKNDLNKLIYNTLRIARYDSIKMEDSRGLRS